MFCRQTLPPIPRDLILALPHIPPLYQNILSPNIKLPEFDIVSTTLTQLSLSGKIPTCLKNLVFTILSNY